LLSGLKAAREEVVSLCRCLDEEEFASALEEELAPLAWKGGIFGLKVVFFFPLLPQEDIVKVVRQPSSSLNRWDEAEKERFWSMRKGLGERFGVAFSFDVIVTDTELTGHGNVTGNKD
jgi:hypothetical protein